MDLHAGRIDASLVAFRGGVRTAGVSAFLRRHAAGLLVAAALAALLITPRWWVLSTTPDSGARVPISPWGASRIGYDEALYAPSIRQAFDGKLPVTDPYLVNHQDAPPQPTALWQEVIGVFGRVTDDPFTSMAIVTTIAGLAALVLLYFLALHLTGSRWAAIAVLPVALMWIQVLNEANGILPLRHWDVLRPILAVDPQRQLHAWTRFPAPIMVLAPFLAAVLVLPKAVEQGGRRWIIASAAMLALLVYSYLYYWSAAALALTAWGAWLLYERDFAAAKRLLAVSALTALLALPEIVVLVHNSVALPADARARVGLEDPGIDVSLAMTIAQRVLVGLPFLFVLLRGPAGNRLYICLFLAPLALAGLTGLVPQPWHYSTQIWGVFALPALVAGGAALVRSMPAASARFAVPALGALALIGIAYFAVFQARALRSVDGAFAVTSDEDAALTWISRNVHDGQTVVSPSITTNLLIAGLTPASQYLADGGFSKARDDELIDRVLRAQAAYGYTEDTAIGRFSVDNDSKGFPLHDNSGTLPELEARLEDSLAFFTFSFEISDQKTFTGHFPAWRARYHELLSQDGVLAAYPADYLYCGHRERLFPAAAPAPATFVTVAFQQGDVTLYRLAARDDASAVQFAGCR
jgi:hypothetical protein